MSFIEVSHLKYRYPHTTKLALDDLSFSVERGEIVGIIGANGAGKSTLAQALIGLVPQFYKGAYGGSVMIDGINCAKTPTAKLCQRAGLVFQNPFNQISGAKDTVEEEIAFGLENFGVAREEMKERIDRVLELLDIEACRDKNPFDLSGGQMQRVAIASILVMQPDVIVLDEPTSQLDPQGSEEVFLAIEKLAASGMTVFLIEQKLEKIAEYANRVLLLSEGRQIAYGTPEEIFALEDLETYGIEKLHKPIYEKSPGHYEKREVLRAENIHFSYVKDQEVLHGINLTFDGRPTAIIGQNGAGKTTLVKMLKGLLKPEKGHIFLNGEDIANRTVASMAAGVGYVFQNPDDQIFKYKVLDEVMFGPLNIGMDKTESKRRAMEALELGELQKLAEENPYDLELFERKLIAIASVVAMNPDVLILDEPTIAQDAGGRRLIGNLIDTFSAQGKLVLAVLHDMDFVVKHFARIIVMAKGEVLADGTATEVFVQDEVLKRAKLKRPANLQLSDEKEHKQGLF